MSKVEVIPFTEEEIERIVSTGILVTPWHHVDARIREFASYGHPFVSLISWEHPDADLDSGALETRTDMPHLKLCAWDTEDHDFDNGPTKEQVLSAIEFARQNAGFLIVNCQAGKARSTATAYAILCDRLGSGNEKNALDALVTIRPNAAPNILIVQHADDILVRNGSMVDTILADPDISERREKADRARWLWAMTHGIEHGRK